MGNLVGLEWLELLAVDEGSEALEGSRDRRPPTMVRTRGAEFCAGVYAGREGAKVILLVRREVSRLVCRMVIRMLKGAISYARLWGRRTLLALHSHWRSCGEDVS